MNTKHRFLLFFLLPFLLINQAYASLIISPLRIVFDERDRSASVVVVNSGKETTSYRMSLTNLKQFETGEYKALDPEKDDVSNMYFADKMLRFSPRQVTLEPGERQTIRISLRKPSDIEDGEYRTHLKFTELPKPVAFDPNPSAPRLKLFMLTGFTIPIQVIQGEIAINSGIEKVELKSYQDKDDNKRWQMMIDLKRSGDFASVGKLSLFWAPNESQTFKRLSFLDNATLYREVSKRQFSIVIPEGEAKPGVYKVVYEGTRPFKTNVIDQTTVSYPQLPNP